MTPHSDAGRLQRFSAAIAAADGSTRLQAALSAGTDPDPAYVDTLVARCAVEPDFSVREMLTWAIVRHRSDAVLSALVAQLDCDRPQARSQALHTLSKLGDSRAWPHISSDLLSDTDLAVDADNEVARAAWRAAVTLAPPDERPALARILVTQLGRGGRDTWLSLSRAFVVLSEAGAAAVEQATRHADRPVRVHARATQHLAEHPEDAFDYAVAEAELGP